MVSRFLRRHVAWAPFLERARDPFILSQVLTNPLTLHIVLKIWGTRNCPDELIGADDPEAYLWQAFTKFFVDASPLRSRWPHFPRYVKALAASALGGSTGDRLYDSLHHRYARRVTVILSGLLLLPLAYIRKTPSLGIVALVAVYYGVRPAREGFVFWLSDKLHLREPPMSWISHLVYFSVLFGACRTCYAVGTNLLTLQYEQVARPPVPLWREILQPAVFNAYWTQLGSQTVTRAWDLWTVVPIAVLASMAVESDLASPTHDMVFLFFPGFRSSLSRRCPILVRGLLVATIIADLYYPAPASIWLLAAVTLPAVIYRLAVVAPFVYYTRTTPTSKLNLELSRTGLVRFHAGNFRFMHDRAATVLSRLFLSDASSIRLVRHMMRPTKVVHILDTSDRAVSS